MSEGERMSNAAEGAPSGGEPALNADGGPQCPAYWCSYPPPHRHTEGSPTRPTFAAILSDHEQQLDEFGEVSRLALSPAAAAPLTTAEKEWLSDEMVYGYDAILLVVAQIVRSRHTGRST